MSQHESLRPEPTPPPTPTRRRGPRAWLLLSAVVLCLAVAAPVAAFTVLPSNGASAGTIRLVDATTVDVNASPTWSSTMQAEDAQITAKNSGYPGVIADNPGFRGAAYLGNWGMASTVAFTFDAPIEGDYRVTFRYGVAEYDEGASRVLSVDTKTLGTVAFERTATVWSDASRWKVSAPTVIHVPAGRHTLRLAHNGNPWTNWLDLDEVTIAVSAKAPAPTVPAPTTASPSATSTTAKPAVTTTTASPAATTTTAKPAATTTTAKPAVTTVPPTTGTNCGGNLASTLNGSSSAAESAARLGAMVSSKGCASKNLTASTGG
jgi:hypothetical protein